MIDASNYRAPAGALGPALAAMTGLQALVALALFAPGAVAPGAGISIKELSIFSMAAFSVSLFSSFWGGALVQRFGPLRMATLCSIALAASMCLATLNTSWTLLVAGLVLGLAAGPETPASSALLGRLVTPDQRPAVFSIRQTGNQIGAIFGSLALPPLAVAFAPSYAYVAVAISAVAAAMMFEALRPAYAESIPSTPQLSLQRRFQLVVSDPRIATLALASMPYSAMQVTLNTCFVSFGTSDLGLVHVEAGWALAFAQTGGLLGRLGWGTVASKICSARHVLVIAGAGMALCAIVFGLWGMLLGKGAIFALAFLFGLTASGWNGVFIAELANLAPDDRVAETTGAALTASFLGLLLAPPLVASLERVAGLRGAFIVLAILSAIGAAALLRKRVS